MSPKRIPALTIVACVIGSQQYLPAQDRKLLARIEALEKQVAEQNTRLQNLADIEKINKLMLDNGLLTTSIDVPSKIFKG